MSRSFLFVSVLICLLSNAQAAVYKGQKVFIKKCSSCHNNKLEFISKKTTIQWEEYLAENTANLLVKHQEIEDGEKVITYLTSENFKKKRKHLLDFFVEYANDSGNVPACY